MRLPIIRHSYKSLRIESSKFLDQYYLSRKIPIPIEKIAEIGLKIPILPIPNLRKILGVDGFIGGDLKEIRVDEEVYNRYPQRNRFTIAHELGHFHLHREIYEAVNFSSISEYQKFLDEVNPDDYGWIEWQAFTFAGFVLVPPKILADRFKKLIKKVGRFDRGMKGEEQLYLIGERLASEFDVSTQVIRKRIERDRLLREVKI